MNANIDKIDEIEQQTRLEIIRLEEESDQKTSKKIIEDISKEFEKWFKEAKRFVENQKDNEKVQEAIAKVKEQSAILLEKTKIKLQDIKEDEKVQDFMDTMKDTFNNFTKSLQTNDTLNKVKDNVADTFTTIKNDEKVQAGVKKAKRSVLNVTEKALTGIQKALQEEKK